MKSYTTFKDSREIERAFRVYGYRCGRKLEILLNPDQLGSGKIVFDLGWWIPGEGYLETAKEILKSLLERQPAPSDVL